MLSQLLCKNANVDILSDDFKVVGINCENENKIRRHGIDEAIQKINPTVFSENYTVDFFPVVENGIVKSNIFITL